MPAKKKVRSHALRVASYRRHKPSGRAVVTLRGKDHYLGEHGSAESHEAYRRLIAAHLSGDSTAATPRDDDAPTVNGITAAYWQHLERKHEGELHKIDRVRLAQRPLCLLFGSTRAADFGPKALKAVRHEMIRQESRES